MKLHTCTLKQSLKVFHFAGNVFSSDLIDQRRLQALRWNFANYS